MMNDEIPDEEAPEEFQTLKKRAIECIDAEEAFKLKRELESWSVDCFDVTELRDANRNYDKAMDNIEKIIDDYLCLNGINKERYRNVTHTQDLERLMKRYQEPKIVQLGEVKLLTWKKDTYILTRKEKIAKGRKMRKEWKEEKTKNGLTVFRNYKDFINKQYGIPLRSWYD